MTSPSFNLNDEQKEVLTITAWTEIGIYSVTAVFTTYLCYAFLIKHKFYKEIHLLSFYVLTYLVIGYRIVEFSMSLRWQSGDTKARSMVIDLFSYSAMYCKMIMGIVESDKRASISMELYLIHKNQQEKRRMSYDELKALISNKLRKLRMVTYFFIFAALTCQLISTILVIKACRIQGHPNKVSDKYRLQKQFSAFSSAIFFSLIFIVLIVSNYQLIKTLNNSIIVKIDATGGCCPEISDYKKKLMKICSIIFTVTFGFQAFMSVAIGIYFKKVKEMETKDNYFTRVEMMLVYYLLTDLPLFISTFVLNWNFVTDADCKEERMLKLEGYTFRDTGKTLRSSLQYDDSDTEYYPLDDEDNFDELQSNPSILEDRPISRRSSKQIKVGQSTPVCFCRELSYSFHNKQRAFSKKIKHLSKQLTFPSNINVTQEFETGELLRAKTTEIRNTGTQSKSSPLDLTASARHSQSTDQKPNVNPDEAINI